MGTSLPDRDRTAALLRTLDQDSTGRLDFTRHPNRAALLVLRDHSDAKIDAVAGLLTPGDAEELAAALRARTLLAAAITEHVDPACLIGVTQPRDLRLLFQEIEEHATREQGEAWRHVRDAVLEILSRAS